MPRALVRSASARVPHTFVRITASCRMPARRHALQPRLACLLPCMSPAQSCVHMSAPCPRAPSNALSWAFPRAPLDSNCAQPPARSLPARTSCMPRHTLRAQTHVASARTCCIPPCFFDACLCVRVSRVRVCARVCARVLEVRVRVSVRVCVSGYAMTWACGGHRPDSTHTSPRLGDLSGPPRTEYEWACARPAPPPSLPGFWPACDTISDVTWANRRAMRH